VNRQSRNERARQKLATAKVPWVTGVIGLAIVGIAFLISIVNASKDTPNQFVAMTLPRAVDVSHRPAPPRFESERDSHELDG